LEGPIEVAEQQLLAALRAAVEAETITSIEATSGAM
jgi:hypothetical protein